LIPAQFVKSFVKSNNNDFVEAEAMAEAVQKANMRFVPIKTQDQLDLQALHRVRDRLMERRTSLINHLRVFLLERGITVRTGVAQLKRRLNCGANLLRSDGSGNQTSGRRVAVHRSQIDRLDLEIKQIAEADSLPDVSLPFQS
jgi:transposase